MYETSAGYTCIATEVSKSMHVFDPFLSDVRCREPSRSSQKSFPFQAQISASPLRHLLILSISSRLHPGSARGWAAWRRCRVMMRTRRSLAGFPPHQAQNKGGPGPLGCSKYSLQHAPANCLHTLLLYADVKIEVWMLESQGWRQDVGLQQTRRSSVVFPCLTRVTVQWMFSNLLHNKHLGMSKWMNRVSSKWMLLVRQHTEEEGGHTKRIQHFHSECFKSILKFRSRFF